MHLTDAFQLYTLYLEPLNEPVVSKLYVHPTSRNSLVRLTVSHQLRAAAEAELLKHSAKIDIDDIYAEADKALDALENLLGDNEWFFGGSGATLFDAGVFAYTHLLLREDLGWKEKKLVRSLRKKEGLVKHRERILELYYNEI
jgi:metaxin